MRALVNRKAAALALLTITLLIPLPSAPATAAGAENGTPAGLVEDTGALKQLQRRLMMERARARIERARAARRDAKPAGGIRSRRPREESPAPVEREAREATLDHRFEPLGTQALAANVRANNRATDVTPASTQSEESIAAWGQYVLVAWNDGEKAGAAPPNNDVQGYGFSTNGGATFTDGGTPPKGTNWTWISDPVVTVNEKTGTFYFCALVDSTPSFNGIGIVPATFSGSSLVWGTPQMIRKVSSTSLLLDKPWVVADSTSDSLYVSYTTFTFIGFDHIQFQRSPNGAAWTPAITLSAGSDSGYVQGSRPVVGPLGEVYVIWYVIGPTTVDFFKMRKSINAGSSFGASVTIPSGGIPASGFYANWGTGAPGFNRERGLSFPGIAVDRSGGPNRGRVYVTWNESINFYDDYQNTGPGDRSEPPAESGANNTPATATTFTVNNEVRGAIGSATDIDYFSFTATQGQTGVFFLDSLSVSLDVSFRIFCSDGVTRLAFSNFGIGSGGLNVFTFPATGTYYLRTAGFDGTTGGYRIRTKFSVTGTERARDHRDVFVTSSANGTTGWTIPVRVNDDPGYFDDWLPEVAVSGQGMPFVMWYDWRDSPPARCGGLSHVYLALSQNAGATWSSLGAVTNVLSDWTNSTSNLAPNQGDYLGLYVNHLRAYLAWADVRDGDPDVYTASVLLSTTPVLASLVSADARPDRVGLAWHATGAAGLPASVQRRTPSSDWAVIARFDVPDNERVAFSDVTVSPGARYGYRLGIAENGAESFFGEAWVDVPSAALAITSIAPNPAVRDLWVSFSLAGSAPATLQLIDVAGRSVRTRELPATAGTQRVNLGEGSPLPMGIYLVRLTQGGRVVSARTSVVR